MKTKKLLSVILTLLIALGMFILPVGCGKPDTAGDDTGGGEIILDDDGETEEDEETDDDFNIDGQEIDKTNFDTPETGFTVDGVIDQTEQALYNTLGQSYGVEGQIVFSYYIGTKGLYFHFDVNCPIVFKANDGENEEGTSAYTMDSDRVELFIDTLKNGGSSPKADDFHFLVTLEGYYIVRKGDGSKWVADGTIGIDAAGTSIKDGTTVSVRDKNAESNPQSSKNTDPGYEVEFFISYKNYGFTKQNTYGLSIGQTDVWSVVLGSRFNVCGSNLVPSEFRSLSPYGFGTTVELEEGIEIDGEKDDFYTPENVALNAYLYRFSATREWGQTKGDMTVETYVYLGENGIYIYMYAQSAYLRYYYQDFPYKSDHVEIRIDSDNNKNTTSTAAGDRWFFQDILGAQQTAYGISNENRAAGSYDLIAVTRYTGELVDNNSVPVRNIGSQDPKTFTFEAFFPYYAINVARGATFGMILECGNPNEGPTGIGNAFYEGSSYAETELWWTFQHYDRYTEFTTPA
jgi:hypothetical protein